MQKEKTTSSFFKSD